MAAKTGHDSSHREQNRQVRYDWKRSKARMEQQGNRAGVAYFNALLGGYTEYEAQQIAKRYENG